MDAKTRDKLIQKEAFIQGWVAGRFEDSTNPQVVLEAMPYAEEAYQQWMQYRTDGPGLPADAVVVVRHQGSYFPQSAEEWDKLLAGSGVIEPIATWQMRDRIGSLGDNIPPLMPRHHKFVPKGPNSKWEGPADETCHHCGADPRNVVHEEPVSPFALPKERRPRAVHVTASGEPSVNVQLNYDTAQGPEYQVISFTHRHIARYLIDLINRAYDL